VVMGLCDSDDEWGKGGGMTMGAGEGKGYGCQGLSSPLLSFITCFLDHRLGPKKFSCHMMGITTMTGPEGTLITGEEPSEEEEEEDDDDDDDDERGKKREGKQRRHG